MTTMLRDGTGKGYLAKVNLDNELHTIASTRNILSSKSLRDESAFSLYGRRNFSAGSTNEGILYFEYTGTKLFFIDEIIVAGNGSNNKVEIYADSTYTSGGTEVEAINFNRTSANSLSHTSYNGSSTLVVAEGNNEIEDVRFGVGTERMEFHGALILGNGNNIYILGEVTTASDKIRATIFGYEGDKIT